MLFHTGGVPVSEPGKQNYLHGAAILTAGVIIMKVLGAIYKIPLANILGDAGYGYFNAAYTIYSVLFTISTAGLPVALSRLVSEAGTLGHYNQMRRTMSVALAAFAVLGAALTAVAMLFPTELAIIVINVPEASQCVSALAPAVLLVCLTSAYRGYIQGQSDMKPTTVSQVLEVLVKVIVGLVLAEIFIKAGKSIPVAAAGAMFGVTAGSLAALIYIWFSYRRRRRSMTQKSSDRPDSRRVILGRLLKIGIPITLGASVMSIITLLDTKLVNYQLGASGISEELADVLYGAYSKMISLFNLPAAFITPLTISIVPAISAAVAIRNHRAAGEIAESSMRIAAVISLPMCVGLSVLSYPIVNVLYTSTHEVGPLLLTLLGVAGFFVCMALMMTAVLQANGNERFPMYSMIVGGVLKLVTNWFLVGNPDINIVGAPVGTIVCYAAMCVMNGVFLKYAMRNSPSFRRVLIRPLISSLVMGAGAWAVYNLLAKLLGGADISRMSMAIAMCAAIAVAVVIYVVLIIVTRAVTLEDMKLIPKGEKIAALLKIR